MGYQPRRMTPKRRRKACPHCGRRFTIKKYSASFSDFHALQQWLGVQHQKNAHQIPTSDFSLYLQNVQRAAERALNPSPEFSHSNTHSGHLGRGGIPRPTEQKGPEIKAQLTAEEDWWHGTTLLGLEAYAALASFGYYGEKDGRITLPRDFGTFTMYSSGVLDMAVDTSRPDYIESADRQLQWLATLAGKTELTVKTAGQEVTFNVAEESPLARKISGVLHPSTTLALFEPLSKLKVYQSTKPGIAYRVESDQWKTIIEGLRSFWQEHLPDVTLKERFLLFFDAVKEGTLQEVVTLLKSHIHEEEAALTGLETFAGTLTGTQLKLEEAVTSQAESQKHTVQLLDSIYNEQRATRLDVTDRLGAVEQKLVPGATICFQQVHDCLKAVGVATEGDLRRLAGFSSGKTNRILRALIHEGEVERWKDPHQTGRGRRRYLYQVKEVS